LPINASPDNFSSILLYCIEEFYYAKIKKKFDRLQKKIRNKKTDLNFRSVFFTIKKEFNLE
jgi:hypothetical protein